MAELLAVAGGISSFITIAELALHLVQGCRQLIRDAKDAPKDVRKLVEELEILGNVAEGIERIVGETENEELRTKVDEAVRAPLERCMGIVDGLKGTLAEYERGFRKAGAKLWWEKVKAVKGKKGVSRFLDEIERAKLALVLAHQNASSITAQSQTTTLGNISQSVSLIRSDNQTTSAKIDGSYNQGEEILTVTKSTQQHLQKSEARQREDSERHKTIQTKMERIAESQNQTSRQISRSLEFFYDSHIGLSTKMDSNFSQGETIMTMTKSTNQSIAESERSRKEDSEKCHGQLEQISSAIGTRETLFALVAEACDAALDTRERNQQNRVEEISPDSHDAVPHSNNDPSAFERSMPSSRRHARWNQVSRTCHFFNRYLYVSSTTREEVLDEDDLTREPGLAKRKETTFTVRSTLPFLKLALYYSTSGTAWDPVYERKLRYTRVFTFESAIWKACKACDLNEVRRLFISGEASPFMKHEWGYSLVDRLIIYIADKPEMITNNHVQLVDYLVRNCGRGMASLHSYTVFYLLATCSRYRRFDEWRISSSTENSAKILRLVVEYSREDPLDYPKISSSIDVDNSQDAVVTALTQQTFWPLNLRPALDESGNVVENLRQMLEDPEGIYLRELLEDANYYEVQTLDGIRDVFAGLFELTTRRKTSTDSAILRECCKNRMKLLIDTPKFHRLLSNETLDFEDVASIRLKNPWNYPHQNAYVGGCAIRHGHRALLEEVFHELGWSDLEIDDFFDKETFYCVPDLLDGDINYETSQRMQQEFILSLCEGAFTKMPTAEMAYLATQISYTVNEHYIRDFHVLSVIESANTAFISKSTPGSWPDEGEIKLVPGVDFQVSRWCEEFIFSWYRDYVDPNFVFELSPPWSSSKLKVLHQMKMKKLLMTRPEFPTTHSHPASTPAHDSKSKNRGENFHTHQGTLK